VHIVKEIAKKPAAQQQRVREFCMLGFCAFFAHNHETEKYSSMIQKICYKKSGQLKTAQNFLRDLLKVAKINDWCLHKTIPLHSRSLILSSLNNSENHLLVHNHQNDSQRVLFTTCGTPFSLRMLSCVRNDAKALANTLLVDAFRFITLKTSIMQMKIHRPSTLDCRDRE
jgi:hypothetical protein